MNMYRITFNLDGVDANFVAKADDCKKAIGKWLVAMRNSFKYAPDLVTICSSIINDAEIYLKSDNLSYKDEHLILECQKSMEIDDSALFYDPTDAVIYTHQKLPDEFKLQLTLEDIEYILDLNYQYMEENGFILEEGEIPDPEADRKAGLIWDQVVVSAYVQQKAFEDGNILSIEEIDAVFDAEMEYYKAVNIVESNSEPDNQGAIDLTSIKGN